MNTLPEVTRRMVSFQYSELPSCWNENNQASFEAPLTVDALSPLAPTRTGREGEVVRRLALIFSTHRFASIHNNTAPIGVYAQQQHRLASIPGKRHISKTRENNPEISSKTCNEKNRTYTTYLSFASQRLRIIS